MSELGLGDLLKEVHRRWVRWQEVEQDAPIPQWQIEDLDIPWMPYETYMRAKILHAAPMEMGLLFVEFPPGKAEDNRFHIHPISARIITVVSGSGAFTWCRSWDGGAPKTTHLRPGSRIWMPAGVLHTLRADADGLLVQSIHLPWVPLEHPACLIYPWD